MPTFSGPCVDCGTPTTRYVRRGKVLRCLDCGIARSARWNREMHARTGEQFERCSEAGRREADAIRAGGTVEAERWAAGVLAAAARKVAQSD